MVDIDFIYAWIVAMTAMSGFSSLWSTITDNEFREHILLSHLYTKGEMPHFTIKQWLIGWCIHTAMGALFLVGYEVLWHLTGLMRSIAWSLLFGAFIGLLGIIGWMIMFKFNRENPKINFAHFYIHLFFAHLVFSLSAYLIYSLLN